VTTLPLCDAAGVTMRKTSKSCQLVFVNTNTERAMKFAVVIITPPKYEHWRAFERSRTCGISD
jgi:hypothetical protein